MNYYQQIISILKRLKKDHPSYEMGRHISTALCEYDDVWGVSDKEFLFALKKYELELNIDVNHNQEEVDEIMKDGMNLNNILFEEEEE